MGYCDVIFLDPFDVPGLSAADLKLDTHTVELCGRRRVEQTAVGHFLVEGIVGLVANALL